MLRYSLTHSEPVRAKGIRFGLLSPEEIERMAVCEITETTLYYRGLPASGGLLDPLMGSVDRRHKCASCLRDARSCEGHPGFMRLAYPVYHIGFIDKVMRMLRCVCFFCSRVCATEEDVAHVADASGRNRLALLHVALRTRKACPHCGAPKPLYARTSFGIKVEWASHCAFESSEEEEFCLKPFTAREALSVLRNMPDADVELLGFHPHESHPMHMITQCLAVSPPCSRPAIYSSEGSRSRGQNDLTVRLMEVLRRSHEVKHAMNGASIEDIEVDADFLERLCRLQYEVFLLVNSGSRLPRPPGMGRNGNASLKSLGDRLKGKEGRVRGNLMGKRVDFSARCVISPDAYFDCDRVGVPHHIAGRLTVPEVVNASNIHGLTERVRIGTGNVRGADVVLPRAGGIVLLEHCTRRGELVLRPGDVVERYLQDDDVVVFNRQPSLHLHSMQAHRVTLMPGHTFRLSLAIAGPYNADFDGDEMNLHVAQSNLAMAECQALLGVAHNCVDSQANRPSIGVVQDALLGAHLITRRVEDVFTHARACRLLGATRHTRHNLPPPALRVDGVPYWTGKQLISEAFPENLFVGRLDASAVLQGTLDGELPVVVAGGRLLCGVLSKATLGTSAGGIIDVVCRDFGGVACLRVIGDVQRMVNAYLLQRAHHVGIRDVLLGDDGQKRVCERMAKAVHLCEEIQRSVGDAPREVHTEAEGAIVRMLSKALLQAGGIVHEHMGVENAIRGMVSAGSKGSFINLSQICACLGQQQLEGARIAAEDGGRALPAFAHDDKTLLGRGMVLNSFALGLSPTELFFHGIGGREGLVDTAVKTSQTGYLQRRMNKSMEDHRVAAGGLVCDATGNVVSFGWGTDGYHPARVERMTLDVLRMPEEALASRFTLRELALLCPHLARVHAVKRNVLCTDYDARVLLPFHTRRTTDRLQRHPGALTTAELGAAWERVIALCADAPSLTVVAIVDTFRESALRDLCNEAVLEVLHDVERRIAAARNTRGDSVGCIAAQSVGESFTQMTLNSFHTSGCGHQTVSMGIPRLRELMDASRAKTPCTTVRFHRAVATHGDFVRTFAETLPLTLLADVVERCEIRRITDEGDADVRRAEAYLFSGNDLSSFVIRLTLAEAIMKKRGITPPAVRRLVLERFGTRAAVSSSEVNSLAWVLRIRLRRVNEMIAHGHLAEEDEGVVCHRVAHVLLQTVVVAGHRDVRHTSVSEQSDGTFSVTAFGNFFRDCAASCCVDWASCTSNDIWDVYELLGIEACASVFFEQLKSVVCFDGRAVDDRHLLIITDTVCRHGYIMPLNRHGINRVEDTSPLMRASFEETIDVLGDAALYASRENARGVTTNIMTGQLASFGSGDAHVLVRESAVVTPAPVLRAGRCMRSTCRSATTRAVDERPEYIIDNVRPCATRSLSPCESRVRKRARFRPVSPTK